MGEIKIYCGHAISGRPKAEIVEYYKRAVHDLKCMGYDVYHPVIEVELVRNEMEDRANKRAYNPMASNHSIKERDKWMVKTSDVVFMDFTGATMASIGCTSETAWGDAWDKHVVVVMEKDNIHQHAFILEMADVVLETYEDAMKYLEKLIKRDI